MCKTKFENIIHPFAVVGLVAVVAVHGHVLDACDNLETCFIEFLVKIHTLNMCKTKFENIIHPLAVVGLVAVVVVHGHVLDACDNLETCFIEFLVKKHT